MIQGRRLEDALAAEVGLKRFIGRHERRKRRDDPQAKQDEGAKHRRPIAYVDAQHAQRELDPRTVAPGFTRPESGRRPVVGSDVTLMR